MLRPNKVRDCADHKLTIEQRRLSLPAVRLMLTTDLEALLRLAVAYGYHAATLQRRLNDAQTNFIRANQ